MHKFQLDRKVGNFDLCVYCYNRQNDRQDDKANVNNFKTIEYPVKLIERYVKEPLKIFLIDC